MQETVRHLDAAKENVENIRNLSPRSSGDLSFSWPRLVDKYASGIVQLSTVLVNIKTNTAIASIV